MIFIYIIFSAILLYYALKYGVRNGLTELEANKEDLIYYQKNLNLFEEIGNIYYSILRSQSEQVDEAKAIYDSFFDILFSEKGKFTFEKLTENKEQISKLSIEK